MSTRPSNSVWVGPDPPRCPTHQCQLKVDKIIDGYRLWYCPLVLCNHRMRLDAVPLYKDALKVWDEYNCLKSDVTS